MQEAFSIEDSHQAFFILFVGISEHLDIGSDTTLYDVVATRTYGDGHVAIAGSNLVIRPSAHEERAESLVVIDGADEVLSLGIDEDGRESLFVDGLFPIDGDGAIHRDRLLE